MGIDYTTVTEVPGDRVTQEQLERMFHRYCFAVNFSKGKDILEVACGAGQGLGYLARRGRKVFAGDYTERLIKEAKRYYKERVPLLRLDAHFLPFMDHCFDVVIFYEALYYLAEPEIFIQEAYRVLREGGVLLIASVNKDWSEFNPSPFSTHYFSVPELGHLIERNGFRVEFFGAFSAVPRTMKGKIISAIRKFAIAFHLIPKTMKGKEFLKKVFYGDLVPLKEEIEEDMYEYLTPVPLPSHIPSFDYKVIYTVARVI